MPVSAVIDVARRNLSHGDVRAVERLSFRVDLAGGAGTHDPGYPVLRSGVWTSPPRNSTKSER